MSVIGTVATLQDFAKRSDPGGKIQGIIELMTQDNPILKDMLWVEGNLPTGHLTTVRTGLPNVTWRKLNYGVPPSKSSTKQITDHCGMLEGYSDVDKKLAMINNNTAAWRLGEDMAFLESMNIQMAETVFYGEEITPEKFIGLTPRYNILSGADSCANVINAKGDSEEKQSSIWIVTWGQLASHGIFPQGSGAGFKHEDLGEVTLTDEHGGLFQGLRSHYAWDCGLSVRDWRRNVRICNIDTTKLGTTNAAKLYDYLTMAYHKISKYSGRKVIYCNSTVATYLDLQAQVKTNVHLTQNQIDGEPVTSYRGIPIRVCDAIKDTEAVVD